MTKDQLIEQYRPRLAELLPMARKAYGSRDTKSPQHDASREYTQLLVEFYAKGGSLLAMAKALGVTYAGVRRRVITDEVQPSSKRIRSKATPDEVLKAVERINLARSSGSVQEYHEALRHEYEDNRVSLTKIAKAMGLSSANPLYYGVAKSKLRNEA